MIFYQKAWFLYLCLFLIPPVGIILLWIVHKDMNKTKKIILTVIFCIWTAIALVLGGGNRQTSDTVTASQAESAPESLGQEEKAEDDGKVPTEVDISCRALANIFISKVVKEKFHFTRFSITNFSLDESGDGTIEALYFPENAGTEGNTKVNFTFSKIGKKYTITYALLAGSYEVDLDAIIPEYKSIDN